MRNICITCKSVFESPRSARFCPDKASCRQAFNRKERHIKDLAATIIAAAAELVQLANDPNFRELAKYESFKAEKEVITRLDNEYPGRHPKKEITAYPVVVEPKTGDKLYAFDDRFPHDMLKVTVSKIDGVWIDCSIDGNRWNTVKLSARLIFFKMVEPETDQNGREVIEKYNSGCGNVINNSGQTEIAQIAQIDSSDDDDYMDDDASDYIDEDEALR